MSGSFSGLTNALAALNAQSYGLSVTGQNMANANTAGYTRQRAEMGAVGPVAGVSTMYATQNATSGGVAITGTSRLNDAVLDSRVRSEHGKNGQAQTAAATMSGIETMFDEPSDNGLASQLGDFWNSWATVAGSSANNADGLAARQDVLQKGATLASTLNTTASALAGLTQNTSDQLNQAVSDVNSAASSLAQLNGAIAIASATGASTNALADQRDSLLLKLADTAGVNVTLTNDGQAAVTMGGQSLVSGTTANVLAVAPGYQLTVGGTATGAVGGKAQGLVNSLTTVLPSYASQLDAVAAALSSTVNAAMANGYDLAGNAGTPFFSGTTASTISVAITDPNKLAAAGVQTPGGNSDGSNANALAQFGTLTNGADSSYRSLVVGMASAAQSATQGGAVQATVTSSVDAQQQSVSGVSIDEETTSLLTYQRSYQAASRVLTTVDETLDTLINHTGRAGL